jgi:hypothetical protein
MLGFLHRSIAAARRKPHPDPNDGSGEQAGRQLAARTGLRDAFW